MAKKKDNIKILEVDLSNEITEKVQVNVIEENKEDITKAPEVIIQDNPMSKKVKPELDKVKHNKNNEVLKDSDLIGNVIL